MLARHMPLPGEEGKGPGLTAHLWSPLSSGVDMRCRRPAGIVDTTPRASERGSLMQEIGCMVTEEQKPPTGRGTTQGLATAESCRDPVGVISPEESG